nr:hypothetical protein [Methylomarinum sp. Ch1-1]MDP4521766.1 hypothetical protein [Methylomarinum sp. Ch1-1]
MAPAKTGVAKYVAKQASIVREAPTGVAKYMTRQILSTKVVDVPTGVEKYMDRQEQVASEMPKASSVAKYLTKRAILTKNTTADVRPEEVSRDIVEELPQESEVMVEEGPAELTGVAKYLAEKAKTVPPVRVEAVSEPEPVTGVEKYLRNRA